MTGPAKFWKENALHPFLAGQASESHVDVGIHDPMITHRSRAWPETHLESWNSVLDTRSTHVPAYSEASSETFCATGHKSQWQLQKAQPRRV